MDSTNDTKIGVQVGEEAVARVVQHADDIRTNQSKYLSVTNEPHLVALRGQLAWLETRRRDLRDRLQYLPPVGDARVRWRRSLFCWTVAIVLAGAGFFLALLTLEPYQFGWKGYLCCIGIAIAVPFLVDLLLEEIGSPRLVKGLVIVASIAGLTGVVLLASVRGDLLATQVQSAAPAIEVDDAAASPRAPTDFYGNTLGRQRLLMELLALAMELGAALAIYQARRHGLETSDNPDQVRQALGETETQMLHTVAEIRRREIEPQAFEAAFMRDYSRAVLNGTKRALTKYLPVVVLLLLGGSGHVLAAERHAFVVAIDLTQSVAARDATDASEFAKNCAAVKQFLSRVQVAP